MYAAFRKGKWIEYTPSVTASSDPRWTDAHKNIAAAIYATLTVRGVNERNAIKLSEAYVFKQLYPGLEYEPALEKEILSITRE
jgi:hypothetical protein